MAALKLGDEIRNAAARIWMTEHLKVRHLSDDRLQEMFDYTLENKTNEPNDLNTLFYEVIRDEMIRRYPAEWGQVPA